MTAQNLKNAILQLAMQGKLVPQDPEDEPASELLKRIQAEKLQLVKEGKRKKGTPLQPISVDEIPFDIPESWVWVRLGECSSYAQKKEKADKNTIAPDTWSLDLEDIEKGTGRIVQKCLFRDRNISGERVMFQKGQILYSKLRPYLKKVLVAPNDGVCSSEIVPFSVYAGTNAQYMAYVLTTPHIDFVINSVTYGTKMPRVGTDTMTNLLIPLPPLAEQSRIVAKIEELLPYIEEYDAAEKRLTALSKKFPEQLRKSFLQQAIMGKLTERNPADEPARELLKRIQAEKSRLIKEGKLKKEKPLPTLSEDDYPFDIPDEWEWVRLTDVGEVSRGRSKNRPRNDPSLFEGGIYPFIQTGDVAQSAGTILECHSFYNEKGLSQSRMWPKGTLCLTIAANIGDVGILNFDACFPDSVIGFNAFHPIKSNKYFLYMLMAYKTVLDSRATKSAQKNINLDTLASLAYPLPPLAEQQRIVERVEELLAVCGQLK